MTHQIRWHVVIAIAFGIWFGMWFSTCLRVTAQPAPEAWTLAIGRVTSTEQESQECYFPIGQVASVNLHPKGEYCPIARGLIGRTGRLVFMVDP